MAKRKIWWGLLFRALSVVLLAAPMLIWFFINRDVYFAPKNASSISTAVLIGLAFVVFLLVGALKELNKRTVILICLVVALAIVWFLAPIMNDLFWMILCAIIGDAFYLPLSAIASRYLKHYSAYREERVRVEARREAQHDANEVFM